MIVASINNGEGVLIGLSRGNVEELLKGHPILKNKEDTGLPVTVVIVGGETEEAILAELQQHFQLPNKIEDLDKKGGN
jgi:hypothetical protein